MVSFASMAAQTNEEIQRKRLRKRLIQGLLLGGVAVGLPALANAIIRRRAEDLPSPRWGRTHRHAWGRAGHRPVKVVFQCLGEGPPVVLLHSLGPGHSSEEWREVAERLKSGHRIYAPDLPGWGRSDLPPGPPDADLYGDFLADFLGDVVRDRALVIAAGLPAAFAVEVAAGPAADQIRGLGLVAPLGLGIHAAGGELGDEVVHRLLHLPVLGTSALNLLTSRSNLARHLRQEVYAAPERVDAALVDLHYRASHRPGAHVALGASISGRLDRNVEDLLPELGVPVWLAWGRHCLHPPVEDADLWLLRLGGAELTIFEDSGAQPHAEEPGAFADAVATLVSRVPE